MKKCKGTGRARGSGCGLDKTIVMYGLCFNCRLEWAMNTENGKEWLKKQTAYKQRSNEKEKRKETRNKKNDFVNWSNKLQEEINRIVRKIDYGLPCLARNKGGQMHAGHVYARGGNKTIRYNLHNIHRQNAQSNHFQNDDGLLREGLVKEYGQSYMDFISQLRRTPSLEFNNKEFQEKTTLARKILREFKCDVVYGLDERIKLRNEVNLKMGLYSDEFCTY